MSGIGVANNFDVKTTKVLDNRCAGPSIENNAITYKAPGLLRYETDNDAWKYWNGTNFVSLAETYTQGTGVTINPSNQISIGQRVGTVDDVMFNDIEATNDIICKNIIKMEDTFGAHNITLDNDGTVNCSSITSNTYEVVNSGTTVFEVTSTGIVNAAEYNVNSSDYNLELKNDSYASVGNYTFAKGMFINGSGNNTSLVVGTYREGTASFSYPLIESSRGLLLSSLTGDIQFYVISGKSLKLNGTNIHTAPSDDRIKFNETLVENGLDVINQVNIYKYDKVYQIGDTPENDPYKKEVGVIAQEIQQIPELAQSVVVNEVPEGMESRFPNGVPMSVYYDQIHSYHIKATQELHNLVKTLQARIEVLEKE